MKKILMGCLVISLSLDSGRLEAFHSLEDLQDKCSSSSACYYQDNQWHQVNAEAIDPWGLSGLVVGVGGIAIGTFVAVAVPLVDRLIDWAWDKYGPGTRLRHIMARQGAQDDALRDIDIGLNGVPAAGLVAAIPSMDQRIENHVAAIAQALEGNILRELTLTERRILQGLQRDE